MVAALMQCPRCWGACGPCDRCDGSGLVPDVRLSRSFTLVEFLRSETAREQCLVNEPPNDPNARHLSNLIDLCRWLLQPVRDYAGPLVVTSGYRAQAVNAKVSGAASGSAHAVGLAADVRPLRVAPVEIMRYLPTSGIEWDQAILYPGRVHLGLRHPVSGLQRRELRVAHGGKYPMWRDAA